MSQDTQVVQATTTPETTILYDGEAQLNLGFVSGLEPFEPIQPTPPPEPPSEALLRVREGVGRLRYDHILKIHGFVHDGFWQRRR